MKLDLKNDTDSWKALEHLSNALVIVYEQESESLLCMSDSEHLNDKHKFVMFDGNDNYFLKVRPEIVITKLNPTQKNENYTEKVDNTRS